MEPRRHIRREITAGVTTFLTMSYIIVVNPSILSTPGTGLSFSGVMTATVILAAAMTLLMGLLPRIPFAVAPGMGMNAYLAFHVILGQHVDWRIAFGLVTWSGVAFIAVSVTPLRTFIARSVPHPLRVASASGIGLLLSLIALRSAGIVVGHPSTLVTLGPWTADTAIFLVGLLVTLPLLFREANFAFLAGIVASTLVGAMLGKTHLPSTLVSAPDFSLLGELALLDSLQIIYLPIALAILLTDLFDSLSTFVGVAHAGGLLDEQGEPRNLGRALFVDALATFFAGILGTSAGTAYAESSAGIRAGGRTGLTAVVCALCFLPFLFLGPLAGAVPPAATAATLLLVGVFMFTAILRVDLSRLEDAVPAYLSFLLIPFTMSIAQGILTGLMAHPLCYVVAGRKRELTKGHWALALLALAALGVENYAR